MKTKGVANKGKLFVVSAPSGSGKTTLCQKLIQGLSGKRGLARSISVTTRKPRKEEHEGRDYFFISRKDFFQKRRKGEFLEWARVLNNYYGTPRKFVEKHIACGDDILLSIDVQGAMKLKQGLKQSRFAAKSLHKKRKVPHQAVFIFVLPPSFTELQRRLMRRSTEGKSEIAQRLQLAKKEMSFSKEYNYVVINDKVATALARLKKIIQYERGR